MCVICFCNDLILSERRKSFVKGDYSIRKTKVTEKVPAHVEDRQRGQQLYPVMAKGAKIIMVMLESLAGTGHKLVKLRPKLGDKMETIAFDPYVQQMVLYKEIKKIRTLKK